MSLFGLMGAAWTDVVRGGEGGEGGCPLSFSSSPDSPGGGRLGAGPVSKRVNSYYG